MADRVSKSGAKMVQNNRRHQSGRVVCQALSSVERQYCINVTVFAYIENWREQKAKKIS